MSRKREYYLKDFDDVYGKASGSKMSTIKDVFKQERDWTCSIGCLRTLLSANDVYIEEDDLISINNIKPGPKSSKDIKEWNIPVSDIIFGFESPITTKSVHNLTKLMETHNVMVECMLNYAHWIVLLAYVDLGDIERDKIIYYDPYYGRVNDIIVDEFISMWYGIGDNLIDKDYIAIRKE